MHTAPDALEHVRAGLDALDERPVGEHVEVLTRALDTIVVELDELAKTIPPAR